MSFQLINQAIVRRVKTDLILGPDNLIDNLKRTGEWAIYAQPESRGKLSWTKTTNEQKKISFDPFFDSESHHVDEYDYKKIAWYIISAYRARAGRCTEHTFLALFYWLLEANKNTSSHLFLRNRYLICNFKSPFSHTFLLIKIEGVQYICDPWLNIAHMCVTPEDYQEKIKEMRLMLYENAKADYDDTKDCEAFLYMNQLKTELENLTRIFVQQSANYDAGEAGDLFRVILAELKSNLININHSYFFQTSLK